jgi:hypothetical protein
MSQRVEAMRKYVEVPSSPLPESERMALGSNNSEVVMFIGDSTIIYPVLSCKAIYCPDRRK